MASLMPVLSADRALPASEVKASRRMIPQVLFERISVAEAIEFLRRPVGCDLPPGMESTLNMVFLDDVSDATVTLNLSNVSLKAVLELIAEVANLAVTYEDDAVIIHKRGHRFQRGMKVTEETARAMAMVLPRVQFPGITVAEAVDFFRSESIARDSSHRGINLVLKPGTEKAPEIHLDLKKVPVAKAIYFLAETAHLRLEAEDHALILSSK